jgi:hypothetical protein
MDNHHGFTAPAPIRSPGASVGAVREPPFPTGVSQFHITGTAGARELSGHNEN